jgi:hypothetical protein
LTQTKQIPTSQAAGTALGVMPEELKSGAKQALAQRWGEFTTVARELKDGKQTREQALATVEQLLSSRPDLIDKFKAWSLPASNASGTQPAATPKDNTICHASSASRPEEPRAANVLTDLVFRSQPLKGGVASALAHIQAFPHTSRAVSYWLQQPIHDKTSSGLPDSGSHANMTRTPPPHAFGNSTLANRRRTTPSAPDLPIKMGGGIMQPLNLNKAIQWMDQQLDKPIRQDTNRYADSLPTSSPPHSARSREESDQGSLATERTTSSFPEEKEFKAKEPRRDRAFLTGGILQRAEETGLESYCDARMKRSLDRLRQGDQTLTQLLSMMKQALGAQPGVEQAKLEEDRAKLSEAAEKLRQEETRLQEVSAREGREGRRGKREQQGKQASARIWNNAEAACLCPTTVCPLPPLRVSWEPVARASAFAC